MGVLRTSPPASCAFVPRAWGDLHGREMAEPAGPQIMLPFLWPFWPCTGVVCICRCLSNLSSSFSSPLGAASPSASFSCRWLVDACFFSGVLLSAPLPTVLLHDAIRPSCNRIERECKTRRKNENCHPSQIQSSPSLPILLIHKMVCVPTAPREPWAGGVSQRKSPRGAQERRRGCDGRNCECALDRRRS